MALKSMASVLLDWHKAQGSKVSGDWQEPRAFRGHNLPSFLGLVDRWSEVVGAKLSGHTLPLKIVRGCLVIMTSHPLYADHLKSFEGELVEKVGRLIPRLKGEVKKISFRTVEHFDIVHSQREREGSSVKSVKQRFHQFDPRYRELKKKARRDMPPIDHSDLDSLLEDFNVLYHDNYKG